MDQQTPTVLIVEDEDVARRNLAHILEKEGYAVVAVSDGGKALKLLKQREFDLVRTDLRMNKVDGMAVLSRLPLRRVENIRLPDGEEPATPPA